ncbi:MAG TPA: A/G-specific adenine glycosylase [Candidatus Limnocylindrales bacterium]|nr:A/G-specific adenine glycosylase [Candidatus Limnocylindrales bacterium]
MPHALPADARVAVLAWYDARGRALSFRTTRDPWAILVSEVMAQQTQISRVVEAWSRFLVRFPTVMALAAASPADVLRAWRGMGYDRRALNLHRTARVIVAEHDGQVPRDLAALQRLPGIGPYTARAVASIAFGMRVGAVDTNVRRVLGRALGGGAGLAPPALQAAADASVDPDRPADWTHSVMDIGAKVCRPARPRCDDCPLRPWCQFARSPAATRPRPLSTARDEVAPASFKTTTRWLRGRIVDRLRDADGASWIVVEAPIGDHAERAIDAALTALARDGIIELDPLVTRRARLSTA